MAITPQSYPFSGGAFMGGGGTEVRRDDIHSLTLTRNGSTIGNYNPLTGDTTIDIPKDAVVVDFDYANRKMNSYNYQQMVTAVQNNRCVILHCATSDTASMIWQMAGWDNTRYSFSRVGSDDIFIAKVKASADTDGNHQVQVESITLTQFHEDGAFTSKTSTANVPLELFSVNVQNDGIYIVSLLCHIRPTTLAGSKSEIVFSIVGPDGVGLPNTTRSNIIDNSDGFDQPVEFTVILRLKAGTNSFRAFFTGVYTIFGDRWSVTSL